MAKEQEPKNGAVIPLEIATSVSGQDGMTFVTTGPDKQTAIEIAHQFSRAIGGSNLTHVDIGEDAKVIENGRIEPSGRTGKSFGPPAVWNAAWEPKGPGKNWQEN